MKAQEIKQELFNRAFTGMRKQGFVQSNDSRRPDYKTCLYRGESGLRCVVGQLIDDPDEARWADGNGSVNDLFDIDAPRLFAAIGAPMPDDQDDQGDIVHFLVELQQIHDQGNGDEKDMERGFILTAQEDGLTVPA